LILVKEVNLGKPAHPTGNIDVDIIDLQHYKVNGKVPEKDLLLTTLKQTQS
jgi:hypothetical protein